MNKLWVNCHAGRKNYGHGGSSHLNKSPPLHPSFKLQLIPGAGQREKRCYLLLRPTPRRHINTASLPPFIRTPTHTHTFTQLALQRRKKIAEQERENLRKRGSSQQQFFSTILSLCLFFFLIYRTFLRKLHCSRSLSLIRPFVADYHSGRQRAGNV